eukprot:TRINITY_DN6055_c0_g1_i1.p1 TRINITY_DN6055_c0_g1~~TRINITY_DN6055_c0_g1_i1.p1  ORF type:complete len:461 (+),score=66.37 TRINITY_DN6055_c0_g1_i1:70-1452(+)
MGVNRNVCLITESHEYDATKPLKAKDEIIVTGTVATTQPRVQEVGTASSTEREERLAGLRLDLGMPPWLAHQLVNKGTQFRRAMDVIAPLNRPMEVIIFFILGLLPCTLKNFFMVLGFRIMMSVFRLLPRRLSQRGVHDSLSPEVHAMTFLYWFARLMPVNFGMCRAALAEMGSAYVPSRGLKSQRLKKPEFECSGLWLHTAPSHDDDPPVLFWCYGGCFIGGSAESNAGLAEQYGRKLKADVFIPDYRLYPEATIQESYADVCRAYEWLLTCKSPEKICLFGVSAGGGIAIHLAQLINAPEEQRKQFFLGKTQLAQPAGCATVGPFVDYGGGDGDSIDIFSAVDWIVTQRVVELILPNAHELAGGHEKVRGLSPLYHPVQGLCPMCISISDHEICVDQCKAMVEKLKVAGNEVQLFTHPYLPHAFQLFSAFLPEARLAEAELLTWMRQRFDACESAKTD